MKNNITFGQYYWKNSKGFLAFVVITNLICFMAFGGSDAILWLIISVIIKITATIGDYLEWKKKS